MELTLFQKNYSKVAFQGFYGAIDYPDGTHIELGCLGRWYDPDYLAYLIENEKRILRSRLNKAFRFMHGHLFDKHNKNPMGNVVNYTGLAVASNLFVNQTLPPKFLGVGSGAGAAAQSNTTLSTEQWGTNNDGVHNIRPTCSLSATTTSQTNDTLSMVGSFSIASGNSPLGITNAGFFDTNGQASNLTTAPSGGNLFASSSFSVINLDNPGTLTLTGLTQFS